MPAGTKRRRKNNKKSTKPKARQHLQSYRNKNRNGGGRLPLILIVKTGEEGANGRIPSDEEIRIMCKLRQIDEEEISGI